jgi:hypothetical protein
MRPTLRSLSGIPNPGQQIHGLESVDCDGSHEKGWSSWALIDEVVGRYDRIDDRSV